MARHDLLLLRKRGEEVSAGELGQVRDWLAGQNGREFVAAARPQPTGPVQAKWGDIDSFESIEKLAPCAAAGEIAVLPLTDLIGSGQQWTPRLHLVDLKRPNDRGEVPIGGAY